MNPKSFPKTQVSKKNDYQHARLTEKVKKEEKQIQEEIIAGHKKHNIVSNKAK